MSFVGATALYAEERTAGDVLWVSGQFLSGGGLSSPNLIRFAGNTWLPLPATFVDPLTQWGELLSYDPGGGPVMVMHRRPSAGTDQIISWDGTSSNVVTNVGPSAGLEIYDFGLGPVVVVTSGLNIPVTSGGVTNIASWDGATISWFGPSMPGWTFERLRVAEGVGQLPWLYGLGVFSGLGFSSDLVRWTQPLRARPSLRQAGPGAPSWLGRSGLIPGRELFTVFSTTPCTGGIGTGPPATGGLCVSDPSSLVLQLGFPLGFDPFHTFNTSSHRYSGPFFLPAGQNLDALCLEVEGPFLRQLGPPVRLVVN